MNDKQKGEIELRNKIMQQLKFYTISGQDEDSTIQHIIAITRAYFKQNDSILDEVMGASARALDERDKEIERLRGIIEKYEKKVVV